MGCGTVCKGSRNTGTQRAAEGKWWTFKESENPFAPARENSFNEYWLQKQIRFHLDLAVL